MAPTGTKAPHCLLGVGPGTKAFIGPGSNDDREICPGLKAISVVVMFNIIQYAPIRIDNMYITCVCVAWPEIFITKRIDSVYGGISGFMCWLRDLCLRAGPSQDMCLEVRVGCAVLLCSGGRWTEPQAAE